MTKKIYLIVFILLLSILLISFTQYLRLDSCLIFLFRGFLVIILGLIINQIRLHSYIENGIKKLKNYQIFKMNFLAIYISKENENLIRIENSNYWLDSRNDSLKNIDESFNCLKKDCNKILSRYRILKKFFLDKDVEIALIDLKTNEVIKKEIIKNRA